MRSAHLRHKEQVKFPQLKQKQLRPSESGPPGRDVTSSLVTSDSEAAALDVPETNKQVVIGGTQPAHRAGAVLMASDDQPVGCVPSLPVATGSQLNHAPRILVAPEDMTSIGADDSHVARPVRKVGVRDCCVSHAWFMITILVIASSSLSHPSQHPMRELAENDDAVPELLDTDPGPFPDNVYRIGLLANLRYVSSVVFFTVKSLFIGFQWVF